MIHNKQAWGGEIGHQRRVGLGGSGHENRPSETRGIQTRHHRRRARTLEQRTNPIARLRQTLQSLLASGDLPAGGAGETG